MLEKEDYFWRQRAKMFWLQQGDQNINFFHKHASSKKRQNHIAMLRGSNGQWIQDSEALQDHIHDYFSELFSATDESWKNVVGTVTNKVSGQMNELLLLPLSLEEIRVAIF